MTALINMALLIFELLILARVLLSWFPNVDPSNPLIRLIYDTTEPILRPIRELMPQTGMFDFSPIIVLLIVQVLRALVI
ncbi:MAG: YggT family protein [Anaerolineae bacterium]|nr:YggT family protein [Anaerolineae bacterium]